MPRPGASCHKIKPPIDCSSGNQQRENLCMAKSCSQKAGDTRKDGQGQNGCSTAALVKSSKQCSTAISQGILRQSQLTRPSAKVAVSTAVRCSTTITTTTLGLSTFVLSPTSSASTSNKPGYTITCPLPSYIFGPLNYKNSMTRSQLIHLTYPTSASQGSAFSRISAYSESRDYVGQYLGLGRVRSEGIRLCKGYVGHNVSVKKVAAWLRMMWDVEMSDSCAGPAGQSLDKKSWMEFATPEEVQLIEILIEVGMLWISLNEDEESLNEEQKTSKTLGNFMPFNKENTYFPEELTKHSPLDLKKPIISVHHPFVSSVHSCNKRDINPSLKHGQPSPYIISQISQIRSSSSRQTTAHELAHYAYHASEYYRGFVNDLYKALSTDTKSYIERLLVTYVGYAKIVCVDEWQAYLVAEGESWLLPSAHRAGKNGGNAPPVLGSYDGNFKKEQVLVVSGQLEGIRGELEKARRVLRDMWEKGSGI